jgi:hypothetical protein
MFLEEITALEGFFTTVLSTIATKKVEQIEKHLIQRDQQQTDKTTTLIQNASQHLQEALQSDNPRIKGFGLGLLLALALLL